MTAIDPVMPAPGLKRQIPAFAAIGAFGFVVDSGLTYALVRLGLDPMLARIPAFAFATIVNFGLNRWLTFSGSRAPLLGAFLRYCLVCGAGFLVNWSVYALSLWLATSALALPVRPEALPIFVAFGTGVAMFVTFFGFKLFAFRA